jgi:hypothetical protein
MADASDQFADFFPAQEGGGTAADPWADFNPQGPKTPKSTIPEALMRRFIRPAAEGGEAAFEGLGAEIQQTQQILEQKGLYHPPGTGTPRSWVQFANEEAMLTGLAAADTMLRVPNAILQAAGAVLGQNVSEAFGQGEADQARARRDMAQAVSIAGMLAGGEHPIARAEPAARVDRTIGTLPKPTDFVAASKVIAGQENPVVVDKLLKLHDEFGINPAEVAHDAPRDPDVAASILSPQPADLPRRYTAAEPSEDAKLDGAAGIKAYHGSPYDFERFDISKIGTGEGAQSYGHGLYVAENPAVAETYAKPGYGTVPQPEYLAQQVLEEHKGDRAAAIADLKERMAYLQEAAPAVPGWPRLKPEDANDAAKLLEGGWTPQTSQLYQVRIKADREHFLNWDKPLSEQPLALAAFEKIWKGTGEPDENWKGMTAAEAYDRLAKHAGGDGASQEMYEAGIPGIKYLDQGSRGKDQFRIQSDLLPGGREGGVHDVIGPGNISYGRFVGEGAYERARELANSKNAEGQTHNFVLFDDSLIEITHKNGEPIAPKEAEGARDDIVAGRDRYAESQPPEIKAEIEDAARQAGHGVAAEGAAGPARPSEVVGGGGAAEPVAAGAGGGEEPGAVHTRGAYVGPEGPVVPGAGGEGGPAVPSTSVAAIQRAMTRPIVEMPMPSIANSSKLPDGPVVIDPLVPKEYQRPLAVHETAEQDFMAGGMPYPEAHRLATRAERAVVEGMGMDWNKYSTDIAKLAKTIEAQKVDPTTWAHLDLHEDPYDAIGHHTDKDVEGELRADERTPALAVGAAPTNAPLQPIGVGGAGQPRAHPYFTYDDRGTFAKAFDKAISGYQKTFQPELVSDKALQADPLFAKYKSATAAEKDGVIARSEEQHQFWRPTTDTERIDYVDRLERINRGAVMPQEWKDKAERHRIMLDEADRLEKQFGSKAGYVADYFPHEFLDPDKARGFVNAKVAQLGPTWFQKERTFDLIREALEAGLRLKSTNPEDMVVSRLLASADMVERMKLLNSLKEMDLARITKETENSNELMRRGWQPIDAPNREQWLIAPDIQPLWKNAVEARGFWSNEGWVGSTFRGWMAFKAVWVPIKLAVSLYHPLHVVVINIGQGIGRGWTQLVKGGDFEGALESVAQGFNLAPAEGRMARDAWLVEEKDRSPEQKAAVALMNDGGFVPQMSEQLKGNAKRALEDAIDKSEWLKAVPATVRRAIEVMQAPIFERWIPSLKAAAYLNDARALLSRRPELLDDPIQRRVALRTIGKSVDNRFGQMFYGGLFWNRNIKDTAIGTFLSLGWNLGFAREFGGAAFEPGFRAIDRLVNGEPSETRATIRDAQNKLPFAMGYIATSMLINGIMSYGFSGQPPEGMDWFLARIGGTNPDGSPRRITNMSYLREIPMFLKHAQEQGGNIITGAAEMLYNKTMIEPIKEMLQNRDYYGSDIWDENGPVYMKAWQGLKHTFGDQISPITISGANRALITGGQWYEAALAMMGFGPAPAYASRDATQNRISYLYERHVAPFSRPEDTGEKMKDRLDIRGELLRAQKNADPEALRQAADRWMSSGGSRLAMSNILMHVPGDVSMFRALPEPDQAAVMKGATPAEQEKYKPYLKSDVSLQAANLFMQAQKERQGGNTVAAAATEQQFAKLVTDAVANGQLTNLAAFRRSLGQQLTARYAPDIAAIMAQPKKLRGLYMQPAAPQ